MPGASIAFLMTLAWGDRSPQPATTLGAPFIAV